MQKKISYKYRDIVDSLLSVGLRKGDIVFSHSNFGFFGKMELAADIEDYCKAFKDSIFEVIGEEGTLIVPTFSYTFCNNKNFILEETESVCGIFSEYIRKSCVSFRSIDPNFSVAAMGKDAEYFTQGIVYESFGKNSIFDKLYKSGGKICNFNFDAASTFLHYVEKQLNVPYRYDKGFSGTLYYGDKSLDATFYHFVYDHDKKNHAPDLNKFHKMAVDTGIVKTAALGRGEIVCSGAVDTYNFISETIKHIPDMLIKG